VFARFLKANMKPKVAADLAFGERAKDVLSVLKLAGVKL
jgi:hypothetical protein